MTPIEFGLVYTSIIAGLGAIGYLPMFFRKIKEYFDELGNDNDDE